MLACASPAGPLVIETPAPVEADAGRDERAYGRVLADVRSAMEEELGVQVPPFKLVLHPGRDSFARGLQSVGLDPALARASSQTMDGIGGPGWVQVNERALAVLDWRTRTAMLAHEIVHVLQYEWAGGQRGASEQWLREGFAEWVTERVLVRLGLSDPRGLERRWASVRRRAASRDRPQLVHLRTFPEWLRWVSATQDGAAYDFAAVAVDALVRRHGVDAVVDYFTRFESRQDGDRVFREVFGQSVEEFDAAVVESFTPARSRR